MTPTSVFVAKCQARHPEVEAEVSDYLPDITLVEWNVSPHILQYHWRDSGWAQVVWKRAYGGDSRTHIEPVASLDAAVAHFDEFIRAEKAR